ncbi:MAG: hypothetical protein D9V47_09975 [Clostridia bacterium]|nr:MAG: hypothetical protein D9V47_09975 [Clostridia bacterium]
MIASEASVKGFLADLQVALQEGFYLVPRKKNLESLALTGLTIQEVKDIIQGLTAADYCRGPEEELDPRYPEGDVWLFEVTYLEVQYYVKLKIEDGRVKCLAFHESERWLGHPYR